METKDEAVRLTSLVKTSGCAAKLAPSLLRSVLDELPKFEPDGRLLVGFESADDALVYKIDERTGMIQTVDFFPPMVDDPFVFGQVAAANALSDIYAMGGTPAVAMNLLCFPSCLDISVMQRILEGGYSKVKEAGAIVAGGHTIADPTPKYGLCVTGFADPTRVWRNTGARPGDVLVLTKPLGAGILNTAIKADMASDDAKQAVIGWMTTLNRAAKEAAEDLDVHACTDITGFGLLGHGLEMAQGSSVTLVIDSTEVPLMPDVLELASMGILPEGMYNNRDFAGPHVRFDPSVPQNLIDVLYDPQTSGGLLLSMAADEADIYERRMPSAVRIGRVEGATVPRTAAQEKVHVRVL